MTEKEKQYFEIILEQILHEVKTIAEGHCALDDKMERYHRESKIDHQLSMDLIQHSHDVLKEDTAAGFKALGQKVEGHEDRIRFLERKVA